MSNPDGLMKAVWRPDENYSNANKKKIFFFDKFIWPSCIEISRVAVTSDLWPGGTSREYYHREVDWRAGWCKLQQLEHECSRDVSHEGRHDVSFLSPGSDCGFMRRLFLSTLSPRRLAIAHAWGSLKRFTWFYTSCNTSDLVPLLGLLQVSGKTNQVQ